MENKTIFRKKTMDRISSPEKLTDYLCVTNPGIWIMLGIVVLVLAAFFVWAAVGTLETKADATVLVQDHTAIVATAAGEPVTEGMTIRINDQEYVIASTQPDGYGRIIGLAEVTLPEGEYKATVVLESIHPLSFLLGN